MTNSRHAGSLLLFAAALSALACHSTADSALGEAHGAPQTASGALLVEASCGECQFGLPGDGCDLAVRIDGQAYYVDGSSTDDHGDAHAADGLCNAIRQASVEGQVEHGRFVATSFALLPHDGRPAARESRIGVALGRGPEGLSVAEVFPGSPAAAAGLRTGDLILELNGADVADLEGPALQSIFKDNPEVRFKIEREGETLEIALQLGAH